MVQLIRWQYVTVVHTPRREKLARPHRKKLARFGRFDETTSSSDIKMGMIKHLGRSQLKSAAAPQSSVFSEHGFAEAYECLYTRSRTGCSAFDAIRCSSGFGLHVRFCVLQKDKSHPFLTFWA